MVVFKGEIVWFNKKSMNKDFPGTCGQILDKFKLCKSYTRRRIYSKLLYNNNSSQNPFKLPERFSIDAIIWFHCFLPQFPFRYRSACGMMQRIFNSLPKKKRNYTNTHRGGIRLDVSSYIIFLTPSAARMLYCCGFCVYIVINEKYIITT